MTGTITVIRTLSLDGRNEGRDDDRDDQISGAPSALTQMQKLQSTLEEKLGIHRQPTCSTTLHHSIHQVSGFCSKMFLGKLLLADLPIHPSMLYSHNHDMLCKYSSIRTILIFSPGFLSMAQTSDFVIADVSKRSPKRIIFYIIKTVYKRGFNGNSTCRSTVTILYASLKTGRGKSNRDALT